MLHAHPIGTGANQTILVFHGLIPHVDGLLMMLLDVQLILQDIRTAQHVLELTTGAKLTILAWLHLTLDAFK